MVNRLCASQGHVEKVDQLPSSQESETWDVFLAVEVIDGA